MREVEILVLEDEALIAMDIEMTLTRAGYENVSVHANSRSALAQIEQSTPTMALLDFNIGEGETSIPVAEKLKEAGVPFVFLTGYTDAGGTMPEVIFEAKKVSKPFNAKALVKVVSEVLSNT